MKKIFVAAVMLLVTAVSCFADKITIYNNSNYGVHLTLDDNRGYYIGYIDISDTGEITIEIKDMKEIRAYTQIHKDIRGDEPSTGWPGFINTGVYKKFFIDRNGYWSWRQ